MFEEGTVKQFRRTAEAVGAPPWNMLRGKAFLDELCDVYGATMTIERATELASMPPPTFAFTHKIKSSLGTVDELPDHLKEELASGNIHTCPVRVISVTRPKGKAKAKAKVVKGKANAKGGAMKRPAAALRRPAAAKKRPAAAAGGDIDMPEAEGGTGEES